MPSEVETADDGDDGDFPPEKRLEAPNPRPIDAGTATIPDMGTLRECVAYENANRNAHGFTTPRVESS